MDRTEVVMVSDDVRLIHGDCLDVLRTLDVGSVNAVITDPPYGISYQNRRDDIRPHKRFAGEIAGDNNTAIGQAVIDEAFRRGWPVCTFAHHRRPFLGGWRQWLVWDKGPAVGGGGDVATCWKFTWELVQVGGFGRLNGSRDSAVLRHWVGQNNSAHHPTQKPVDLMAYLIEKLTRSGDIVLDPFMGSGTTGVACARTGRRFIGVEIDQGYYEIACSRIAAERERTALFTAEG